MVAERFGYHMPSFIDPMSSPRFFAILQLVLVIPVLIAGNRFFRVGFKSLMRRYDHRRKYASRKTIGDKIVGASINKNGTIKYKATRVGKDTALAQIIKLVEDA